MFAKYTLGLDLGQQSDYTVLTVAEPVFKDNGELSIRVPYMYRFPLRMSYVHIVEYISEFIENRKLLDYVLVVDHTGVGRPVIDLFRDHNINSVGLTITGGHKSRWVTGRDVTAPKLELISRLKILENSRRELRKVLRNFISFHIDVKRLRSLDFLASIENDVMLEA